LKDEVEIETASIEIEERRERNEKKIKFTGIIGDLLATRFATSCRGC
jgi:hypothetical protein